jgi:glycosyltransferase involved in cell wall biosynthesis
MRRARNQLRALAPRSVAALADSAVNAEELHAMGYRNVSVNPLLLDVEGPPPAADARLMRFLRDTRHGTHWLFVGRLAPNKCQHDVITAFAVYRTIHDPGARLTLVGSAAALSYAEALLALADDVGVADAVTCVSSLSDAELAAYYEDADVFVCLSEHEGFCIPVIEAMRHDTPVVAFAAAAVPDTVGAAAVLLDDKDPLLVATAVRSLLTDEPWRARLAAAGQARVLDHAPARTVPCFVEGVERALAAARADVGG